MKDKSKCTDYFVTVPKAKPAFDTAKLEVYHKADLNSEGTRAEVIPKGKKIVIA